MWILSIRFPQASYWTRYAGFRSIKYQRSKGELCSILWSYTSIAAESCEVRVSYAKKFRWNILSIIFWHTNHSLAILFKTWANFCKRWLVCDPTKQALTLIVFWRQQIFQSIFKSDVLVEPKGKWVEFQDAASNTGFLGEVFRWGDSFSWTVRPWGNCKRPEELTELTATGCIHSTSQITAETLLVIAKDHRFPSRRPYTADRRRGTRPDSFWQRWLSNRWTAVVLPQQKTARKLHVKQREAELFGRKSSASEPETRLRPSEIAIR